MQIVLTINPANELSLSVNGNLSYSQLTDILATAQLMAMNNTFQAAAQASTDPDNDPALNKLKEHMWDQYNESASNVLDEFIPQHMRRDLGEEAILNEEDRLLREARPLKVVK